MSLLYISKLYALHISSASSSIIIRIRPCLCSAFSYNASMKLMVYLSPLSWMRLGFLVDAKGRVPVKVISRTFASGKTEKLVYQGLADLGLPSGKNDTMERDDFTFDKFYSLYHKICPRNDIEELFRSM